jgi:hypothetical protein
LKKDLPQGSLSSFKMKLAASLKFRLATSFVLKLVSCDIFKMFTSLVLRLLAQNQGCQPTFTSLKTKLPALI